MRRRHKNSVPHNGWHKAKYRENGLRTGVAASQQAYAGKAFRYKREAQVRWVGRLGRRRERWGVAQYENAAFTSEAKKPVNREGR